MVSDIAPQLLIVFGLPWSGKSTVSKMIYSSLQDTVLLRTDVIRKELFPISHYTQEESDKVYAEFYRRARENLKSWKIVILDAVFTKQAERDRVHILAEELGCSSRFIYVHANEEISKERIQQRTGDPSEATVKTYDFLKVHFDSVADDHIIIDNSGDISHLQEVINNLFPHR